MRKKIVAANWKMNVMPTEANAFAMAINEQCSPLQAHQQIILCGQR